jgi:hypothetical protein
MLYSVLCVQGFDGQEGLGDIAALPWSKLYALFIVLVCSLLYNHTVACAVVCAMQGTLPDCAMSHTVKCRLQQ